MVFHVEKEIVTIRLYFSPFGIFVMVWICSYSLFVCIDIYIYIIICAYIYHKMYNNNNQIFALWLLTQFLFCVFIPINWCICKWNDSNWRNGRSPFTHVCIYGIHGSLWVSYLFIYYYFECCDQWTIYFSLD